MANYFLKIDGIDGESLDENHSGEIDLESFSWGASRPTARTSGGGGSSADVTIYDINVTKRNDKSSKSLLEMCTTGKSAGEGKITMRKMGGDSQVDYLVVTMKDVMISSIQWSGGGDIPMESLSINFSEVKYEYTEQNADNTAGATSATGWNLQTNTKV